MLSQICLLTALQFSAIYPFSFLISFDQPLKSHFHHFHLGLPLLTGTLSILFLFAPEVSVPVKMTAVIWICGLFLYTGFCWKRAAPNPWIVAGISLLGVYVSVMVQWMLVPFDAMALMGSLLGGGIFSLAFYAMNLGHWYLNVHGLPLFHLRRAVGVLFALMLMRFLLDLVVVLSGNVQTPYETITVFQYMMTLDGLFVWIALIFGTLFPLFGGLLAFGTLKVKNTQATTGILYVILASILIGELTCKYLLLTEKVGF